MLSKEEAIQLLEVIQSVKETVVNIKDNPLLVTPEDLDALDFDIAMIKSFIDNNKGVYND